MVTETLISAGDVWQALEEVRDPEIPVLNVTDLGLIRAVAVDGRRVTVAMTPTFLGCPALAVIQLEIKHKLLALGAEAVGVRVQLSPPWTSDWISERGRERLKAFGMAPPERQSGLIQVLLPVQAICPHCGSEATDLKNAFGATLCRALFYCNACQQPFEQFKAL